MSQNASLSRKLRLEDQNPGNIDLICPSLLKKQISSLSMSVILLHSSPESAGHKCLLFIQHIERLKCLWCPDDIVTFAL